MHKPIDEPMYRLLACDYDGTLTDSERLSPSVVRILRRVRANGIRVALITGRPFDELLQICPQIDLFDLVAAENGGLLFQPVNGKLLAFGDPPPDSLAKAFSGAGIPFQKGRVMYIIYRSDSETAQTLISRQGLDLQILPNRDAGMILPKGIDKGTALKLITQRLNLDPAQAIAVGDGENDLAMFRIAGFSLAPANAIDEIKSRANIVSAKTAGAAVEEFVNGYLFCDLPSLAELSEFAI